MQLQDHGLQGWAAWQQQQEVGSVLRCQEKVACAAGWLTPGRPIRLLGILAGAVAWALVPLG